MVGKKDVGAFILIMTAAIVGIVFLQAIADVVNIETTAQVQTNESISIAAARLPSSNSTNDTYQITLKFAQVNTNQTPITGFSLINASGRAISSGNYTLYSDIGKFNLTNTTYWNNGGGSASNQTYATYSYRALNYVADGASNTIITLIVMFGALGILVVVIVYFWKQKSTEALLGLGGARVEAYR